MKNILITGGAGFIGSNLSVRLLSKGYNIRILDTLSPQIHGNNPEETSPLYKSVVDKVDIIKGSVTNKKDWIKALKNQDAVIHLAAETGTGQSMYEIRRYTEVNVGGTAQLLDILVNQKHKVEKVIVASSRALYGEGRYWCAEHGIVYPTSRKDADMVKGDYECKCPICNKEVQLRATSEDSKIHPSSIYGITKQNQEQMVMTICQSLGISSIAYRYQNVYGEGQSLRNPYTGILSIFSTLMKNKQRVSIFEDGKESRDFVHIDDIVSATILGLETRAVNNEIFNVGSGQTTDVLSIANILKANYGSDSEIKISSNYRIGDIRHNFADLALIKSKLDFSPKVSFVEGINKFCAWVTNQELVSSDYDKSIAELKLRGLYK